MTGAKWNGQGPGVESQPFPLCREDLSFHQGGVGQWRLIPAQMDKEAASDLFSPLPSLSKPATLEEIKAAEHRGREVSRKDY